MSDQNLPPDPPQEETTQSSQSQTSSSSNPLSTVLDIVSNIWRKGSGSGLAIQNSEGQTKFTLPINIGVLFLAALLIGFLPGVIVLIVAALIAQFAYKASFSFGRLDRDTP